MSGDDNKRVVAEFVERCQNQHDLDFADEAFHPKFVNHYRPEGRALPETGSPGDGPTRERLPGVLRRAAAGVSRFRGTHLGELWDLPPTGNRVALEFIDIFRVRDGRLIEHWTSMDIGALRQQMRG